MKTRNFLIKSLKWACLFFMITYSKTESYFSKLIDDFESYMSVEEARFTLPPHLRMWKVIIKQPDFSVILVKNYQSLGFMGQLSLVFTEAKLSGTCFLTPKMHKYVERFQKKNNVHFKRGLLFLFADIYPYTTISVRYNFKGEICWYDDRLDEYDLID